LWTDLTRPNALYRYFGIVGGPLEIAAVIGAAVIAVALRRAHPASAAARLALAAALLHAAALVIWLAVVAPANVEIGRWAASGIPPDWERWRMRWESGHGASFVVLLCGFSLLVAALLVGCASSTEEQHHDLRRDRELGSGMRSREP
jgi:hypothetical protein